MPFLNQRKGENDRRKYFMINLYERMLLTSAGFEPATSWSPVGRRIQLSHRGRLLPSCGLLFAPKWSTPFQRGGKTILRRITSAESVSIPVNACICTFVVELLSEKLFNITRYNKKSFRFDSVQERETN